MPDQGTQIHIFGQAYQIKGGDDPERTRKIAALVDQKMNAIAAQLPASDNFRVAVLTALHLADEYLSLKEEHEQLQGQLTAKSEQLVSLLDKINEGRDEGPGSLFPAVG